MKNSCEKCLTITIPIGAVCGLYGGAPASRSFSSINPENAIKATSVEKTRGYIEYSYTGLEVGIYHYSVSMDGYTSVCQIINYTEEKAAEGYKIDVRLEELRGNGYESGFVMLNSQEFIDAQLTSDKHSWGEKYAHLFTTPQFSRKKGHTGYHQQTTNEELVNFISEINKKCEYMHVFSLGKSPKYNFDMPLVLFTLENISKKSLEEAAAKIRKDGKPTVQYTAQVHSNEPASAEGALAMITALAGEFGQSVLDKVDVYIIPRINLDGAVEVVRHAPATNEDMNRDYLFMNNEEIRMVTSAYNLFLPEVAIDGHEKVTNVLTTDEARCTDMELQVGAGSLNHPAEMTELAMKMALAAISKGQELGLRSHFYQNLASAAGGSAGSSYYGTRNSLSFLVETPGGTTLGRLCMERRVLAQYVLASTAIGYSAEHADEVMSTVRKSREMMAAMGNTYDETKLIVLEHGKGETGAIYIPMIHVPSGEITNPSYKIPYSEHTEALRTRPRPTAYVIPMGLARENEILRVAKCHAIPYYTIPAGSTVQLRQYVKSDTVADLCEERTVTFDKGAYVFVNTVPSTILSVIMEPDFNTASGRKMCLFSMKLIEADESGYIPIYRYCHDLENGKITLS